MFDDLVSTSNVIHIDINLSVRVSLDSHQSPTSPYKTTTPVIEIFHVVKIKLTLWTLFPGDSY